MTALFLGLKGPCIFQLGTGKWRGPNFCKAGGLFCFHVRYYDYQTSYI